ncbi:MAG TPA: hypothetical protein VFM96_14480 [Gaiellaceae bacterium]|nr:hypothetical protein [Gaiellaceae bacterium]
MHPRQNKLPQEIEDLWLAGLADAEIDAADALLYLIEGEKGSSGYSARYLHRGLHIYPDGEAEEIRPLLDEMNSDECIGAYRVVVFMDPHA